MSDVEHTHLPSGVDTYQLNMANGNVIRIANEPTTHEYKGGTITILHPDHTKTTISSHPAAGTIVLMEKNDVLQDEKLDVSDQTFGALRKAMASANAQGFNRDAMTAIAQVAEDKAQQLPSLNQIAKPLQKKR